MGIFIVAASGVIGALFSLGYKVNGLRPNASDQLMIVMSAVSAILSILCMALFGQWSLPTAAVLSGIPQGIASFIAVHLFLSVTRRNRLNVSWTIIQFYVVVPFFVSLLLFHDSFTLSGGAGVLLIFASILLFGRKSSSTADEGSKEERRADRKILGMLWVSTFASGVANSMPKVYTSVTSYHPPFPQILTANITFLLIALVVFAARYAVAFRVAGRCDAAGLRAWHISRTGLAVGGWMGFTQVAGNALLIVGLSLVAGTVAFPIRIVVNIITVVTLSRLFFKEELSRSEMAGTLVAVVGVALVASSA